MFGPHSSLILFLVILPFTLAWRDGAREESCYGHEVEHTIEGNPPVFKLPCISPCEYNLTLDGQVDETSRAIINPSVGGVFQCGSVYRFTLNPASDIGFLIQARNSATDVLEPLSTILGTWLPDMNENYHPLHCGADQNTPTPTYPNSATHNDSAEVPSTALYWKAPDTNGTIQVRFFYTVVATFGTFYEPLTSDQMTIECPMTTEGNVQFTTSSECPMTTEGNVQLTTSSGPRSTASFSILLSFSIVTVLMHFGY